MLNPSMTHKNLIVNEHQLLAIELEKRERKREQNRIAQKTYRINQKRRIRALEAAAAKPSTAANPLISLTESNEFDSNRLLTPSTSPSQLIRTLSREITVRASTATSEEAAYNELPAWLSQPGIEDRPSPLAEFQRDVSQYKTPLHLAIDNGNESMTRLLLERGADITRKDSGGSTALHFAAESGQENIVRLILGYTGKCNPNEMDYCGRTALFRAVQGEHEAVAKLLLEAPTDVNLKDIWGNSALHLAVETGSGPMALLLLEHGANVDA